MSNDRSLRSVFVGNIPYDATEEKLKEAFSEVGPVVSFRLVFDKDSGKPKGYGFCEYRDQETAQSAIRNLNNIELGGRALRVDSAANEKGRDEPRNQPSQGGPTGVVTGANAGPLGPAMVPGVIAPPGMGMGQAMSSTVGSGMMTPALLDQQPVYGQECEPEKAPEIISQAVVSLPPEQMFELAKQMKQCIQSNPQEARTMLMGNPQLAYALLQALVVMRVVDPQTAMSILYRPNVSPSSLVGTPAPGSMAVPVSDPHVWSAAGPTRPGVPLGGVMNQPVMAGGPLNVGVVPPPGPSGPPAPRADPRLASRDPRLAGAAPSDPRSSGPPPSGPDPLASRDSLIVQVMNLTEDQIAQLPPEQRDTIRALKQQLLQPKI